MRLFAVALLMPVAFLIGRATNPTAASAQTENRVYTLLQNDDVRAHGAATRCTASVGRGAKSLFCHHSPEGRYQVVFYTDSIVVWKNGNPTSPPSQPAGNADNSRGPASSS
jgi:hypothetical protein